MMKSIAHWLTLTILIFALYTSGALSLNNYVNGDVCPKLLGIPVCYLIFICIIGGLVSHLNILKATSKTYFVLIGAVTVISLIGMIAELNGDFIGPATGGGTPMSYYSLGISILLLILKFLEVKSKPN